MNCLPWTLPHPPPFPPFSRAELFAEALVFCRVVSLPGFQLRRRVGQHREVDDRALPCWLFARTDASEEPLAGSTSGFRVNLGLVPFRVLG